VGIVLSTTQIGALEFLRDCTGTTAQYPEMARRRRDFLRRHRKLCEGLHGMVVVECSQVYITAKGCRWLWAEDQKEKSRVPAQKAPEVRSAPVALEGRKT